MYCGYLGEGIQNFFKNFFKGIIDEEKLNDKKLS